MGLVVDTSNRHVHLSKDHLALLFGEGYDLTLKKPLYGLPQSVAKMLQFAAEETVDVVNPETGQMLEKVSALLGHCSAQHSSIFLTLFPRPL